MVRGEDAFARGTNLNVIKMKYAKNNPALMFRAQMDQRIKLYRQNDPKIDPKDRSKAQPQLSIRASQQLPNKGLDRPRFDAKYGRHAPTL